MNYELYLMSLLNDRARRKITREATSVSSPMIMAPTEDGGSWSITVAGVLDTARVEEIMRDSGIAFSREDYEAHPWAK